MGTISIEILAEKLNGKLWVKGDLKRIYLDCGYNTKKMTTKTYVYQREDGTFGVSCKIDCPSQAWQWIESQQKDVIASIDRCILRAIWETENPDADYDEHLEAEGVKNQEAEAVKDAEIAASQKDFDAIKDNLLAAKYLVCSKRPVEYTFPTLMDFFKKCSSFSSSQPKSLPITELPFSLRPLTFDGGWAYDNDNIEKVLLPVIKTGSSNKYNYYSIDDDSVIELLPELFVQKWMETKEKTAMYNTAIDDKINELLQGESLESHMIGLREYDMYTQSNRELLESIKSKVVTP